MTSRIISSVDVYKASVVFLEILLKPVMNVRATTPTDTQESEWIWTHEQKDTFEDIKDSVSKAPVLKYFSKSDLTENLRDAFKDGLGFLQMQHGQFVTPRSRVFPMAEREYSFWPRSTAWSATSNMCSIRESSCGLVKSP